MLEAINEPEAKWQTINQTTQDEAERAERRRDCIAGWSAVHAA